MMQRYRSLYPNHVHQLNISVSKHYWVSAKGILKYQHKALETNLSKIKNSNKIHLIHYVIRDHFSGVVYSEVSTSNNIIKPIEFLYRAWNQKDLSDFSGIPELLTIPKTVEKEYPDIKAKISILGVRFPDVTSGFQSGVGDVKTLEEYMKRYADEPLDKVIFNINKTYTSISKMNAREGKQTKLEFWRNNVTAVKIPPESWLTTV